MKKWHHFTHKKADYRIFSANVPLIIQGIIRARNIIERYGKNNPQFLSSLCPISLEESMPEIIRRMVLASGKTGVGPMAGVAGVIAESCIWEVLKESPEDDVIVDNGGDVFLSCKKNISIGIYPGPGLPFALGMTFTKDASPLSVCSSSSTMGHSLSFGKCDLVTVIGDTGVLADTAATAICNKIMTAEDITPVIQEYVSIKGIRGIIAVLDQKMGMAGDIPDLYRVDKKRIKEKVTKNIFTEFL
jgi:uncharacterized protein